MWGGGGNGRRIEHGTPNLTIFLNFPSLSNNIQMTLFGTRFIFRHSTRRKDGQMVAVNYMFYVRVGLHYTTRNSYVDQPLAS